MYVPLQNTHLTIALPGELLRAIVKKVVTEDAAIVEIVSEPLAKSHHYRCGQIIAVRRLKNIFGEEWTVADKPYPSVEQIEKGIENAVASGKKPKRRTVKHKGNDKKRASKKSGSRSKPAKRRQAF